MSLLPSTVNVEIKPSPLMQRWLDDLTKVAEKLVDKAAKPVEEAADDVAGKDAEVTIELERDGKEVRVLVSIMKAPGERPDEYAASSPNLVKALGSALNIIERHWMVES